MSTPGKWSQTARLAEDAVSAYHGELTGTVDLGSLISFGTLDVPKVLGDFHRDYPFVRIRLRQSQIGSRLIFRRSLTGRSTWP